MFLLLLYFVLVFPLSVAGQLLLSLLPVLLKQLLLDLFTTLLLDHVSLLLLAVLLQHHQPHSVYGQEVLLLFLLGRKLFLVGPNVVHHCHYRRLFRLHRQLFFIVHFFFQGREQFPSQGISLIVLIGLSEVEQVVVDGIISQRRNILRELFSRKQLILELRDESGLSLEFLRDVPFLFLIDCGCFVLGVGVG